MALVFFSPCPYYSWSLAIACELWLHPAIRFKCFGVERAGRYLGALSERQWNDLVSLVVVQRDKTDYVYLESQAARLGYSPAT